MITVFLSGAVIPREFRSVEPLLIFSAFFMQNNEAAVGDPVCLDTERFIPKTKSSAVRG